VHQVLVDRYLLRLDSVPIDSLTPVWFDTDAPQLWGRLPLMPAFYQAMRQINSQLVSAHRIRVIGGCEPIAWSAVRTRADVARYPFKNNWAAHVITEHFASDPERRLLVVYGDGHIHHNGGNLMGRLAVILDRSRLFVVGTIDAPDSADIGNLARLGDTTQPFYLRAERFPSAGPYPRRLFYVRNGSLENYVDAILYLGPAPDVDVANQRHFTEREMRVVAQRDAIKGDLRQLLQLRLGNRDQWFRTHPNDLPPDPRTR
jgi:hypothetical protein